MISTKTEPAIHGVCECDDPEVEELRTLVEAGMDQWAASALLWGSHVVYAESPEGRALALAQAGAEGRRIVREGFAAAFPDLRLPPEGGR